MAKKYPEVILVRMPEGTNKRLRQMANDIPDNISGIVRDAVLATLRHHERKKEHGK